MEAPKRIVLLGKTGVGKSSLANAILNEEVFRVNHSPNSETKACQSVTREVHGSAVHLIDTPGFFDTDPYDENVEPAVKCMMECAPGPHAFVIVLRVEKYTEQEKAIISIILQYFSDEALKFATVVFTHGDQLEENTTIGDFVSANPGLKELVEKCGGRCHVFDTKYWNNEQQDESRSNQFQIQKLLETINRAVEENEGGYYTNEMLQAAEEAIRQEEERIRLLSGNMSPEDIREQAQGNVVQNILTRVAGPVTGVVLGAIFGGLALWKLADLLNWVGPTVYGVLCVAGVIVGGLTGGFIGYRAGAQADTVTEAVQLAWQEIMSFLERIKYTCRTLCV